MMTKGFAVLGLVALACAGCATGTRSAARGVEGSNGLASPPMTNEVQSCEGWYNAVAGVCDSMGD